MTFDLVSGLHMQIQTWHPPLRLCIHAKHDVKSGLTNVLKNANKTKNMHLFSIRIANYNYFQMHAWSTNMLLLLHSTFMLSVVKMLLKGEVGDSALNSHGNYIVDHGKSCKNLNFCRNPVHMM